MLGDNSLCVLNSCVETLPFGTPCVGSVRSPSSSILPGKGGVEATTTKLASLSALLSSYAQHTSKMHLAHPFSPALGKANVGGGGEGDGGTIPRGGNGRPKNKEEGVERDPPAYEANTGFVRAFLRV